MGRATAETLAGEGVEVLISARNEERLRRAASEMGERVGREVRFVVADHSTAEGRNALLAACPEPDILVTTVSPPPATSNFRDITEDDWIRAFRGGTLGSIELMRLVVDGMASRRWGRIVNITTVASKYPKEPRLLSGAPRSALANYTSVVARKMVEHNVIINNLLPGLFVTEGFHERMGWPDDDTPDQRRARETEFAKAWGVPFGRIGNPGDFGQIAATFCAEFTNFIVGQNIVLDGGAGGAIF